MYINTILTNKKAGIAFYFYINVMYSRALNINSKLYVHGKYKNTV